MQAINKKLHIDFSDIPIDPFWNTGNEPEAKMHKIHAYPAKFPAFLTTKAVEYVVKQGTKPKSVADVFCGCGTVAYEAKRLELDFWGCDLNPVATLIARAKSKTYSPSKFRDYQILILSEWESAQIELGDYQQANERLKYWFKEKQFHDLFRLREVISRVVPKRSPYSDLFKCTFSNILKPCSVWLTKSIKPQVDPIKIPSDVISKFQDQCEFMYSAIEQSKKQNTSKINVETGDCLSSKTNPPTVDLIVTSPPYVTSYEYADLHQLSTLWLEYAEDYRDLREGSIGSRHQNFNFTKEAKNLNSSGTEMVFRLHALDKGKAKSVAKYFLDMQKVAVRSYEMLNPKGHAFFVIGNTEYKGVRMDNAKHLTESLFAAGFKSVKATKRKISNKFLTPFRTENGRFTSCNKGREIYSEEFILVGHR